MPNSMYLGRTIVTSVRAPKGAPKVLRKTLLNAYEINVGQCEETCGGTGDALDT